MIPAFTDRWWDGACLYQVYVRSWQDSGGDGEGDLAGVTGRLDYLSWLGVDGIWLSPTMPSPDADWGYDVTDYRGVHPDYGDLADLEHLVGEAGRRGIRIVLDLVPNHTSSQHPWFVEARDQVGSPRRDWYVWADPGPAGGLPNNWLDATGQPAWSLDPASGQYYLHNFLDVQPDLNWWNAGVRSEFEDILRYWFDRGIGGFRIDVAHALYHDRQLRDNPTVEVSFEYPFGQSREFSMQRPEVHDVYRAWRRIADSYSPPRLLLGETWVFDPEGLARYYGADDELHLGFNFAFAFAEFTAGSLSSTVAATLAALPDAACPVWCASNHDISRFATRWTGGDPARTRLALTVLATLPGAMVLYYGDELGLTDVEIPRAERRDPMSWDADGRFHRDSARTPMPWDEGPNFGFTSGAGRPWLPPGDRSGLSVEAQRADPASTLHLTRALIGLRRKAGSGGTDRYRQLASGPDQWVYRSGDLVVAANLSDATAAVDLPAGSAVVSSCDPARAEVAVRGGTRLAPWEALVIEISEPTTPQSKGR